MLAQRTFTTRPGEYRSQRQTFFQSRTVDGDANHSHSFDPQNCESQHPSHAPDEGQNPGLLLQPPSAAPFVHTYGAAFPHCCLEHSLGSHAGQRLVGGDGPGDGGCGLAERTIEAHHGMISPPRTSRVQFSWGISG